MQNNSLINNILSLSLSDFLSKIDTNEFLTKFRTVYNDNKYQLGYNINLIEELHANENAHTRILLKLLSYKINDNYPILQSFIDILNSPEHLNPEYKITNDYIVDEISGQKHFIDGYIQLIINNTKYAIIIENKIQNAKDQEAQIDRYVKVTTTEKINPKHIYVVYLTDDDTKKITDYSFNNSKEQLEYIDEDNNGRFIPLNYKNHILPLLYDIQKKLTFSNEPLLKTAIFQYIDYFEGRYGIRKIDAKFYETLNKELIEYFKIQPENLSTIVNKNKTLNYITEAFRKIHQEQKKEIGELYTAICKQNEILKNYIFPEKSRPREVKIALEKKLNDYFTDSIYIAKIQWRKWNNEWIWITPKDSNNNCLVAININDNDPNKGYNYDIRNIIIRNQTNKKEYQIEYPNNLNMDTLFEEIKTYIVKILN